ncbi:MAG: hypothetical protein ACRC20_02960 [Segniliparus sp.]|uniref:hypothetical protein n=1 Tax=Segniliparus sp. TaxID=2804064 RepID=UPI003F38E80F
MSSDPKSIVKPASEHAGKILGTNWAEDRPERLARNSDHLRELHDAVLAKIEELEHQHNRLGELLDSEGLRAGQQRHAQRVEAHRLLAEAVKAEADGDFQRAVLLHKLQTDLDEIVLVAEALLAADDALNGPTGATGNRHKILEAARFEVKQRIETFEQDPLIAVPDYPFDPPDIDTRPEPARREHAPEPAHQAKPTKAESGPSEDQAEQSAALSPAVGPTQHGGAGIAHEHPDPFALHAAAWPEQSAHSAPETPAAAPGESPHADAAHVQSAVPSFGETSVHSEAHSGEAGGHTEAQSAPAPTDTDRSGATTAQSATDSGGPDIVDVEYTDTATQAGAAQIAMSTSLAFKDTDYRPPSAQRVRDERFGDLPAAPAPSTDPESVVTALCQLAAPLVRNQPSCLKQEDAPIEVCVLVEENDDGETVYRFHTNAGFGVNPPGVPTPDICEPGFETSVGLVLTSPIGQRASVLHATVGVLSAAEVAVRDFQFRQEHDKRAGKRRALIGIGSTGPILTEVRRSAVGTMNHVIGEPPPSPFFVDGDELADAKPNADPAMLTARHPLYRAAEGLNPYRGTDQLAHKLDRAVRWWDARTVQDHTGRESWHVQIEFATKLVDDICVAAEVRDRPGVQDALRAIDDWRQANQHTLTADLAAWLPPLWEAVRREHGKKLWDRAPFDIIRPYRAVLARWAFTALLAEYERGWSRAESDPYWLHTICYLHLKAHNDQIGKLDERIPDYPDDIYANL